MAGLSGKRIAVIALDGFEEAELTQPVDALKNEGANVEVISEKPGEIQGFKHHEKAGKVRVDRTLDDANPEDYDALVLPGGALNADALRVVEKAQAFAKKINAQRKPMAVICHAPWLLVSSGLARGRKLTSYHTIADDLRNAGAQWVDQQVVVDDNLVTSRKPDDIPAFNAATIELIARTPQHAAV